MSATSNLPAEVDSTVLNDFESLDVETVLAILTGEVQVVERDTSEISRELMRAILEAPSLEDVLSVNPGTKSSDDALNTSFSFEDFRLMPSRLNEGPGVWMAVNCVNVKTGERFVLSTSSANIMAQLARAKWLNQMPFVAQIKRAEKATANGYYPLRLADVME